MSSVADPLTAPDGHTGDAGAFHPLLVEGAAALWPGAGRRLSPPRSGTAFPPSARSRSLIWPRNPPRRSVGFRGHDFPTVTVTVVGAYMDTHGDRPSGVLRCRVVWQLRQVGVVQAVPPLDAAGADTVHLHPGSGLTAGPVDREAPDSRLHDVEGLVRRGERGHSRPGPARPGPSGPSGWSLGSVSQ